jgi:peroxiredoxin Q/BCP
MKLKALALSLLTFGCLSAQTAFEVGQPAPRIDVTLSDTTQINIGSLYEKGPVLVYFYPKADTPGCTTQACNLRDSFVALSDKGIQVVGVSQDNAEKQAAFKAKYNLPFILVADTEGLLGKAFGVGSYAGLVYKRQTFLIVNQKLVWKDLSATPDTQAQDALNALEAAK